MVTVLGKDSGNSLQKEFPNGDCYLGLQNLTKSRGGGAKIHFFTEKMDFSLVRYRNSSARTHNIWGRTKKIRKNPFFYRKNRSLHHFLQKIHQHGPTKFGVGRKKFAKIHFFTEKSDPTPLFTEIRQTAKTPQKRQLLPLYL